MFVRMNKYGFYRSRAFITTDVGVRKSGCSTLMCDKVEDRRSGTTATTYRIVYSDISGLDHF